MMAVGGVSVEVMDDMTMVDPSFVQGETVRGGRAGAEVCPEPKGTG